MSDIVKKGFFRRCLYRATGAYLLEQHIQMLEPVSYTHLTLPTILLV